MSRRPTDEADVRGIRTRLGLQLLQAATTDRRIPPGRRRSGKWLAGAAAVAVLIPVGFATAQELSGDDPTYRWEGGAITRDGEVVECPVDDEGIARIGFDPCNIFEPAPPPLEAGPARSNPNASGPLSDDAIRPGFRPTD